MKPRVTFAFLLQKASNTKERLHSMASSRRYLYQCSLFCYCLCLCFMFSRFLSCAPWAYLISYRLQINFTVIEVNDEYANVQYGRTCTLHQKITSKSMYMLAITWIIIQGGSQLAGNNNSYHKPVAILIFFEWHWSVTHIMLYLHGVSVLPCRLII